MRAANAQRGILVAEPVGFDCLYELIAELTAEFAAMPEVTPTAMPDDVMIVTTEGHVICPNTQAAEPQPKRRKTIARKAMITESGRH